MLGETAAAVRDAEQSVEFADRSGGDALQQLTKRATLADARHQSGARADALARLPQLDFVFPRIRYLASLTH